MNNTAFKKFSLPQVDGRGLDFIKICAAIFMAIDHINYCLLHHQSLEMMLIGRGAFPLFCYALAVAVWRIDPERAPTYALHSYGRRMMIFAVLAEPVSYFVRNTGEVNILFTLALGGIFAGVSSKLKDWQLYGFLLLAIALHFTPHFVEGGTAGIALPAAILAVMQKRKGATVFLLMLLFTVNVDAGVFVNSTHIISALFAVVLLGICATLLPLATLKVAEFFPADGRCLHKYALHIFYPGHLLILWAIGHYMLKLPGVW